MRRTLTVLFTVVASLALVTAGLADPGEGKGKKRSKQTFTVTTTDNGSCGNEWANDTMQRTFSVKANNDGTFTLTRRDRGRFVTLAARSPGACDTTGNHGQAVVAGVTGMFVGFLRGTVTGGAFNPNATCTGTDCGFTDVFLKTFFGPNATFSCFENSADCKFNFNYTAKASGNPKLLFRHWQDKGKGAGSMLKEEFHGDIATS